MAHTSDNEVLDLHAVRAALGGMSAKTLQRLIATRKFPRPFNLTAQGRFWWRKDVDWFLWGQAIRSRMAPKVDTAGTTVDTAGTTAAKRPASR